MHLNILSLGILTILAYLSAAFLLVRNFTKKIPHHKILVFVIGLAAVLFNAAVLHLRMNVMGIQNLSLINMISLVSWLIALIILFTSLHKPMENLMLFIFPIAAFVVLLILFFPQQRLITTPDDLKELVHVLFAALTFSVLCIAGLQAILLAIQERQLRHKSNLFRKFPPLETMESFLFQMIWLGFILLSIMICTSLFFFHDRISWALVQKIILAFIAWIIFGILLLGRHYYGWRGRKAIYGTLIGVILIFVIYFGSIFLLGILL